MKTLNDWLNEGRSSPFEDAGSLRETLKTICPEMGCDMFTNQRVICMDFFNVSIQANAYTNCSPRGDFADVSVYETFELGFPNRFDSLLMESEDSQQIVFPHVPREVVEELIQKHGGIMMLEPYPPRVLLLGWDGK